MQELVTKEKCFIDVFELGDATVGWVHWFFDFSDFFVVCLFTCFFCAWKHLIFSL